MLAYVTGLKPGKLERKATEVQEPDADTQPCGSARPLQGNQQEHPAPTQGSGLPANFKQKRKERRFDNEENTIYI